jgi:proteasome lid subunit RPN8/RPN11
MKLIIPAEIERRLNAYVQSVDAEIAGMGEVEMREDGNLWVTDIAIYDQEVTSGTADLSPQALANFQTELVQAGKSPKNWYLWWHSHNTFTAFFSGTDTGTIESSTEFDHVVSLVVNKKRERKCRIDTHRPFRLTDLNVPIEIAPEVNARTLAIDEQIFGFMERIEALQKERDGEDTFPEGLIEEVQAKVKRKTYAYPKLPAIGFGNPKNNDFSGPLDESWSKKRKKDGTVITNSDGTSRPLARDEAELLLEESEKLVRTHEAHGNGDSVECEELRADIEAYQAYIDEIDENEEGYLTWTNEGWVDANGKLVIDYAGGTHPDLDDDGYLPLPAPYQYGQRTHGRDD